MILYEGPSQLDGTPIVAIATSGSKNRKTGDMIQVWILSQNIDPLEANRTGKDSSICGNCPLKGKATTKASGTATERTCYVLLQNAPLRVWRAYKAGKYEKCKSLTHYGTGKSIRLGAYGDPAALPTDIISSLLKNAINWTGYTHQTKHPSLTTKDVEFFASKVMLSVETIEQAKSYWETGARTFRVVASIPDKHENEIFCPATPEGGNKTDCSKCGLCKGTTLKARSIAVLAHGAGKKHLNVLNQ